MAVLYFFSVFLNILDNPEISSRVVHWLTAGGFVFWGVQVFNNMRCIYWCRVFVVEDAFYTLCRVGEVNAS